MVWRSFRAMDTNFGGIRTFCVLLTMGHVVTFTDAVSPSGSPSHTTACNFSLRASAPVVLSSIELCMKRMSASGRFVSVAHSGVGFFRRFFFFFFFLSSSTSRCC